MFLATKTLKGDKMEDADNAVIGCHKPIPFNKEIEEAQKSKKLVVVNFTASWSNSCRCFAPTVTEYAKRFKDVKFLKVDVDQLKNVALNYNIDIMPTFVFIKEGREVDRVMGARKEFLLKHIQDNIKET